MEMMVEWFLNQEKSYWKEVFLALIVRKGGVIRMEGYYSEIHERLQKVRKRIPATTDRLNELLPLLEDVSVDQKEHFEIEVNVLLNRLLEHYQLWSKILEASQHRKTPVIRRIK